MDQHHAVPHTAPRREPLGDASLRANIGSSVSKPVKPVPVSTCPGPSLPHNESIIPNGTLRIHNGSESPGNKHLSAVSEDQNADPKRNSAISATSTEISTKQKKRKSLIGPWQLGKTIGTGGCSRVRLVRHSVNTSLYGAAKIISKANAEKVRALSLANLIESAEQGDQNLLVDGKIIPFGLDREITIMKLLEHPNIVRLYDIWENRNELYLIMEYVKGGELFTHIDKNRGLDEDEVVWLFRQIVAALLYCHRLNIHHRDLKPENILIDPEAHTIKLVDFGMAALQPPGRFLSTPCGSPHYAAPEVVSKSPYDGGQADVWSCGVILYVMLSGYTPFNYTDDHDIRQMFTAIKKAEYYMPESFSREAQDLIRRIFNPSPKRRITMEAIWAHPFLHKYDADLGIASLERWVGPMPKIEDWTVRTRRDIDREILRNLRCLWHSEKEEVLIERLLNHEPNQEKYFYSALQKHRDEHLENYNGQPGVAYSNSDYHHLKTPPTSSNEQAPPSEYHSRSKSQYSILNDEHLRSPVDRYEVPPSANSYDPYRASQTPVVGTSSPYTNVTVHRGTSSASGQRPPSSLRRENSLRVATLRKNGYPGSVASSSGSNKKSSLTSASIRSRRRRISQARAASHASLHRSSISRSSLGSSVWPSSPPGVVRPNSMHKRGVSFDHLRRSSTGNGLAAPSAPRAEMRTTPDSQKTARLPKNSASLPMRSTSPAVLTPDIKSRKEVNRLSKTPQIRLRKPHNPSYEVDTEARKVSNELGKACEEAFFRSSIGSSTQDSEEEKATAYGTPPSSFSVQQSKHTSQGVGDKLSHHNADVAQNRPLPALPETPDSFLKRELAETRKRLAAYQAAEGENTTANLSEVMAHIDGLLKAESVSNGRPTSRGQDLATSTNCTSLLSIIDEKEEGRERRIRGIDERRSATDPVQSNRPLPSPRRHTERPTTIRVIEPSSPLPIAPKPLNIRKRSGETLSTQAARDAITPATDQQYLQVQDPYGWVSNRGSQGSSEAITAIPTQNSNNTGRLPGAENFNSLVKKRSGWFKRKASATDPAETAKSVVAPWQEPEDRTDRGRLFAKQPSEQQPASATSSEFPMRQKRDEKTGFREGFLKILGMKQDNKKSRYSRFDIGCKSPLTSLPIKTQLTSHPTSATTDFDDIDSSISTNSARRTPSSEHAITNPSSSAFQQNWISRILHIKPHRQVLLINLPRPRARGRLISLLKSWEQHGLVILPPPPAAATSQLHSSGRRNRRSYVSEQQSNAPRNANAIFCSLNKQNALSLKAVTFSVELFVVLKDGQLAGVTACRITQIRGAASSLKRVGKELEGWVEGRGWGVGREMDDAEAIKEWVADALG
ncbi:MAG: hypothetical protein M1820_003043 [Bogoriella megaspora]|nr:MAG: hypothetical protein M1820_003043 [Bogoriella megaspora]